MSEIWKSVVGYEGKYEVSNFGRVKSLERWSGTQFYKRDKLLGLYTNKRNGYVYVWLNKDGKGKNFRVHKLVAKSFLNNHYNYPDINHIDGNKTNNRVDNLEFCTKKYNVNHYLKSRNLDERNAKINSEYIRGISKKELAGKYNLCCETIRLILSN